MPTRALGLVLLLWGSLAACKSHPAVSEKECGKVVSHAQKLLGSRADPAAKLMADCKQASGEARGCAMAANSAADLLRCSM